MLWLQVLPVVLVALTVVHAVISPNDPLRALALHVPKKPELPICSLKPQQPLDTHEDEILISFEEWKRQQGEIINRTTDTNNSTDVAAPDNASDVPAIPQTEETQKPPPHFRVPLTDRFNYASSECSARVHFSHRGAKSASSILSSKRDRYMLSPCNTMNQYVIVELCEDIRIDTVQLANFEFFSGIFKDFKLSVAKTDITAEGFTDAGLFRAKNIRGVQSFHPPRSLGDFYRYIRIDFLSHYGNEFYCPVSLLRVYGLTHLEQWKWDTWEQESKERVETPKEEPTSTLEAETLTEHANSTNASSTSDASKETNVTENPTISSTIVVQGSVSHPSSSTVVPNLHKDSEPTTPPPIPASSTSQEAPHNSIPTSNTSSTIAQPNASAPLMDASHQPSSTHTASSSLSTPSTPSTTTVSSTPTSNSNSKPPIQQNSSPSQHPHPSQAPGGESIYRTIMNRLTALEANHTLYARYVEQQTSGVREVLRRMGEDVGRLEGIVRAQEQVHFKTLRASEARMQAEFGELVRRVESLRGEIEMEKRVGVAQVCLLAAVLVFMGLTRGSRGDQGAVAAGSGKEAGTEVVKKQRMREWGKRFSSLSGDWRFGKRRSEGSFDREIKIQFPSEDSAPSSSTDDRPPLAPNTNAVVNSAVRSPPNNIKASLPRSRSRTPSMRTRQHQQHIHQQHLYPQQYVSQSNPHPRSHTHSTLPETPTRLRMPTLPLQRSSSGFNTGHRSARRWARTAHLHEVRGSMSRSNSQRKRGDENDPGGDNPFWDGPEAVGKEKSMNVERNEGEKREEDQRECEEEGEGDKTIMMESESDVWVDTDLEEESYMQVSGVRKPSGARNLNVH